MRNLLILSSFTCLVAACGGGSTSCVTDTCASGGGTYLVCNDSSGYAHYAFGNETCDCDTTTSSCNACENELANYCAPVQQNTCVPPSQSSFTANAVYDIAPGASFTVDPTSSNPWFGITSDGAGNYHIEWSDPTGASTCFTGLVTINDAFVGTPVADNGTDIQLNDPGQLSFAGMPGSSTGAIDFNAGSDVVNLEAYTDVNAPIDVYYTDNTTGQVSLTASNVAAFQSP